MPNTNTNTREGTFVYAAILDVLGYRNRLENDRTSGNPQFKTLLQNAVAVLNDVNEVTCSFEVISDTIFLTWPAQETLAKFLDLNKKLFISFLKQGLFLRGGLTYQEHFKSGLVTYSYAFAGAYELESSRAIYPRIVIDENVVDMFQNAESGLDIAGLINSKLILSSNETYFLNIIDADNWGLLRDYAARLFDNDCKSIAGLESAFAKHVWFENYLFGSIYAEGKDRYIPEPALLSQE